jgi:hypothetical protein
MKQQASRKDDPVWASSQPEQPDAFGGGALWIGEHSGDNDILVLDPAETDSSADILALYSLTQHRTRRFPRTTVLDQVRMITDKAAHARAKKEYAQRATRRDGHERALESGQAERMDRMREGMIAAHQRFVAALGLEYKGVQKTSGETRAGRGTKCHVCEIALDDFVGMTCGICSRVLCSCGACACGKPVQGRRATAKAAAEAESET